MERRKYKMIHQLHTGKKYTLVTAFMFFILNLWLSEASTVRLTAAEQQMIGLRSIAALNRPMMLTVRVPGQVQINEQTQSVVTLKYDAWVEKSNANFIGKWIEKGTSIAELYSPEIFALQQDYLNALMWQQQLPKTETSNVNTIMQNNESQLVAAAKQKLRLLDISEAQLKIIANSGKPKRTLSFISPTSGYVLSQPLITGTKLSIGQVAIDLADISTVWLIADVYEDIISYIRPNQSAWITLSAFPNEPIRSQLDFIAPMASLGNRATKVRFILANSGHRYKPNMTATVKIDINLGTRLSIPREAVLNTGEHQWVYLDLGNGEFSRREVYIGASTEMWTEIISGIKIGDKVVNSGLFLLDSEAKLKGVLSE